MRVILTRVVGLEQPGAVLILSVAAGVFAPVILYQFAERMHFPYLFVWRSQPIAGILPQAPRPAL
jgi:hypothetical protein